MPTRIHRRSIVWRIIALLLRTAWAQYAIGTIYCHGFGGYKDEKAGFHWLSRAAKQGHDKAQYELGAMYRQGIGVEMDFRQALKWYRLSAD